MSSRRKASAAGRPSKGDRKVLMTRVPASVHALLESVAEDSTLPMSDLGAYWLLQGLNADRERNGLPPFEIPAHLRPCGTALTESNQDTLVGVIAS